MRSFCLHWRLPARCGGGQAKGRRLFNEVEERARSWQPATKMVVGAYPSDCVLCAASQTGWAGFVRAPYLSLRYVLIVNPHDCFLLQQCLFFFPLSELRCVASTTVWNQGREHDEVDGFIQNRCNDPLSTVTFLCDQLTSPPSPRTPAPRSKTQPWPRWSPKPTQPRQSCWLPTRRISNNR